MIKSLPIRSQFRIPKHPNSNSATNPPPKFVRLTPNSPPSQTLKTQTLKIPSSPESQSFKSRAINLAVRLDSKALITGAVSVGVVLLALGLDGGGRALALGPEGPLMEEFWENMRRYGLYALTVGTGVLYAVFQPIWELLKNPVSALLVIVIAVGGVYIMSQVLSAMVGTSDFAYQYYY